MPTEEGARKRRHRRGEGSTFPVRDGGWAATLSLGIDRRTGKRRVVKRRAPDEKAAERALERLRREYGRAGDVAFTRLDDYLADWLDMTGPSVARRTLESYRGHVDNHIVPLLGPITVGALRPADVHRLIRRTLDAGKSAATVGRIVTTLRMALQTAVRDGELTINVAQVRLPRVDREPVEAMTQQQAEAILAAVAKHGNAALYTLLLGTGMRLGEALALDWRDLDLDAGTVFIRRGKTRAAVRTLPLPAFVVRALRTHRKAARRYGPGEPVFLAPLPPHGRLRADSALHSFQRLLERAGLPKMRLHALRHGTATLLLARGVPMRDIADILGHANPSMTANVYAHTTPEGRRRAMAELDEMGSASGE